MTRPVSKPEGYIVRYEGIMFRDVKSCDAREKGWKIGQTYAASQPNLSLEDIISVAEAMTTPRHVKVSKVYKLSFVLGYLKKLDRYNPLDLIQEAAIDELIGVTRQS